MNVALTPEEADLLRRLLLAEREVKRVEIHHARNAEYKLELQAQEKIVISILEHLGS